jgi:membrane-bound serine protease (ClpP class)
VISPPGRLLTLTDAEAARRFGEDNRPLLSSGTVADLDALLLELGLAGAERRELRVTAAERLARYVAGLAPLFLMAGLLGLYIEIRSPGFGLPGILGLVALAIFFWGHHIAGLAGQEDIVLFLVGVALLTVELVFLPDFGVVGLIGLVCMVAGLLFSMTHRLPGDPWMPGWDDLQAPLMNLAVALVGTVAAGFAAGRFLPSTPLFRRLVLEQATRRNEGFAASADQPSLVGLTGRALAPLRPSGPARFGERRLDVITDGAFLEAGAPVRITEVHGSRVVVAPASAEAPEGETT